MKKSREIPQIVEVGLGVSGLAPFITYDRYGQLNGVLAKGIHAVNRNERIGNAGLYGVVIGANSLKADFTQHVRRNGAYQPVFNTPSAQELDRKPDNTVPLTVVAEFTGELGRRTGQLLEDSPNSKFSTATITHVIFDPTSESYTAMHGEVPIAKGENIIIATGGQEVPLSQLRPYQSKVVLSGDILRGNLDTTLQLLEERPYAPVIFFGAAHSSLSAMRELLTKTDAVQRQVILMYRNNRPTGYYPTLQEYTTFIKKARVNSDAYPIRSIDGEKVNRFEGVRNEALDLLERIVLGEITNVSFMQAPIDMTDNPLLNNSALIVQAVGLNSRRIPFLTIKNGEVREIGPLTVNGQMVVNERARLLDQDGKPIDKAFGLGISAPLRRSGVAQDGVNFYHGPIGDLITSQIGA